MFKKKKYMTYSEYKEKTSWLKGMTPIKKKKTTDTVKSWVKKVCNK